MINAHLFEHILTAVGSSVNHNDSGARAQHRPCASCLPALSTGVILAAPLEADKGAAACQTHRRPRFRGVYIVGLAGSGKTSLARHLAQRYGLRHIEIDALHWQPNWQKRQRMNSTPGSRLCSTRHHALGVRRQLFSAARALLDGGGYHYLARLSLGLVLWRLWRRQRVFSREVVERQPRTLRGRCSASSLFLCTARPPPP